MLPNDTLAYYAKRSKQTLEVGRQAWTVGP